MLKSRPYFHKFNKKNEEDYPVGPSLPSCIYSNSSSISFNHNTLKQNFDHHHQLSQSNQEPSHSIELDNESCCNQQLFFNQQKKPRILYNQAVGPIQPEATKVNFIKQKNKGAICSQFVFCSQIPSLRPHQYKNHLQIKQLEQIVDSFDLILFKNKGTLPKMQRFLTNSQYDHVGMVVVIENHKYLLQATANLGVSMCDLRKFLTSIRLRVQRGQKLNYELGYRKFKSQYLQISEIGKLKVKLREFTDKVLGKRYKFSPIYLMCKKYEKEEQTYFCSQLLAECLDFCGLYTFKEPAYKVLPRDFDQKTSQDGSQYQINAQSIKKRSSLSRIYELTKIIRTGN